MDAREILNLLKDQEADLSRAREINFYFYGSEQNLVPFQAALEEFGFAVRPTQGSSGRIATVNIVVEEEWLKRRLDQISTLIAQYDVEYDGWEAAI